MRQMYNDLKVDGAKLNEVLYYIPEVNKEQFIHVYIYDINDNSQSNNFSETNNQGTTIDDPETVACKIIESAMARDTKVLGEQMIGSPEEIQGASNILILAFSEVKGY